MQSELYRSVGHKRIRQNIGDMAPILFVKIISKRKLGKKVVKTTKIIKCLVDHGSSSSLITSDCVLHNGTHSGSPTKWKTTAGHFTTKKKAAMNFQMNELSETALVHHKFNVHDKPLGQYDMIIGRDLSGQTGLDACGSDLTIKWPSKQAEAPFKDSGLGQEQCYFIKDSPLLEREADRMSRILDAKHSKVDLKQTSKNVKTLDKKQQKN